MQILWDLWSRIIEFVPVIAGVIIILAIGWVAGRVLGKGISKILDKAGVDDALRKTIIGKALERSGVTCVGFFDLIARWFVYLVAIFAAVDMLKIEVVSNYMSTVVQYVPNLIVGVGILIAGFIVVDFVGDSVKAIGKEARVEFSGLLAVGLKLLLYVVVIIIALTQMKIDVSILYTFASALAWGPL